MLQNQIDDIDCEIELLSKQLESLRGDRLDLRKVIKDQKIIEVKRQLFSDIGEIRHGDAFLHGDNILVFDLEYSDMLGADIFSKVENDLDKKYIAYNEEKYYYVLSGRNRWDVLNFDNLLKDSIPLSKYTRIILDKQ